jgi:hypothetical protein
MGTPDFINIAATVFACKFLLYVVRGLASYTTLHSVQTVPMRTIQPRMLKYAGICVTCANSTRVTEKRAGNALTLAH